MINFFSSGGKNARFFENELNSVKFCGNGKVFLQLGNVSTKISLLSSTAKPGTIWQLPQFHITGFRYAHFELQISNVHSAVLPHTQ